MDRLVYFIESDSKVFTPYPVDLAESLSHQTIKLEKSAFLRATFDDHVTELNLIKEIG